MKFRLFCSHKQRTAIGTFMLNGVNMVALQCDKCGKFEVMPMCLMQQLRHNFVFDVDVTGIDIRYIPASHEMMKIIEKLEFEKSILCERIEKLKAEPSVVGDKEFSNLVKKVVCEYANAHLDVSDGASISEQDVYIVWQCKTLQNNKVLASTTLTDGMYYELTYDGDKKRCYVDAYKKWENFCVNGAGKRL